MLVGAALFLCVPVLGWLLNLGHRWQVMVRMYAGDAPWFRGFRPVVGTFERGCRVAALGIAFLAPGAVLLGLATLDTAARPLLVVLGVVTLIACFHAFPIAICSYALGGGRDQRWFVGHVRSLRRAWALGAPYWYMWLVSWATITVSVMPLIGAALVWQHTGATWSWLLALGFFLASPWAWSAIGFAFGTVLVPSIVEDERASRGVEVAA